MQLKSIAAPVEARRSHAGSPQLLWADGSDVSSFTRSPADVDAGAVAWVALPFGREMLAASCMAAGADFAVTTAELATMSVDEFRAWVLGGFLHSGSFAATVSAGTDDFRAGYRTDPELAEFFALLCTRLDADLLTGHQAPSTTGRSGAAVWLTETAALFSELAARGAGWAEAADAAQGVFEDAGARYARSRPSASAASPAPVAAAAMSAASADEAPRSAA